MSRRRRVCRIAGAALLAGIAVILAPATRAQETASLGTTHANVPTPSRVRGGMGRHLEHLPAKVIDPPRTKDGVPNLQGAWNALYRQGVPAHSIEEGTDPFSQTMQGLPVAHVAGGFGSVVVDPPDRNIPYQPWSRAKRHELLTRQHTPVRKRDLDPDDRCWLDGIPRAQFGGFQIFQRPGFVVFMYGGSSRSVPLDGRPHLPAHMQLMMGDSRGRWEGHTLVIESSNFNDKVWMDSHGTFFSNAMNTTERFTLVDMNTMYYDVTVTDPKVFTQPWRIALTYNRDTDPDAEIWENACHEGERSTRVALIVGRRDRAAGVKGFHQHDIRERDKWLDKAAAAGLIQAATARAILAKPLPPLPQ